MRLDEPMAQAMYEALDPLVRKLAKKLRKARRGDVDAVHDARTASRRIREGLALLGESVADPAKTEAYDRRIHRIERALGPVRDDDVLLGHLESWASRSAPSQERDPGALGGALHRRRRRDARALRKELSRKRHKRSLAKLRRWLKRCGEARVEPDHAGRVPRSRVGDFVQDQAWRLYEEAAAYERRARRRADFETIHQFRSSCRRLRFALELYREALRGPEPILAALRELQDRLGALHDHVVAVERLGKLLSEQSDGADGALRSYLLERERCRDRLRDEFTTEVQRLVSGTFRDALFDALGASPPRGGRRPRELHLVPQGAGARS